MRFFIFVSFDLLLCLTVQCGDVQLITLDHVQDDVNIITACNAQYPVHSTGCGSVLAECICDGDER